MSLKKMILSLCLLAFMPMMVPSLMREAYVHPSIQVLNLSNETTTILSTVDFVGTVETEPVVPSSSPIDTIQVSINSFAKEVTAAAILAAKDSCNDMFATFKFLGEKSHAIVNEFLSDTLIITLDTFSFTAADAIDQMWIIFEQFNEQLRALAQGFSGVINSKYEQLVNNENFGTFIGELASLAPRRSEIQSIARNIFEKISVECHAVYKELESSVLVLFTTPVPAEPSTSFAIQLQAMERFGSRISLKSQLVYEQLRFFANDWFSPVPARPAYPIRFVVNSSIIAADAVQTSYSAAFQAYMKLKSLVFPAPEPAPTSLESITRDFLDKIALEFQRFNEKMVLASFLNDLLAPVTTPPPSSSFVQPITAAYDKLEALVTNLFFGPPPPTTFQSIARDVLKTFSVGYEQAYATFENYSTQLTSFQWNNPSFRSC